MLPYGGGADLVALAPDSVFPLPDGCRFEEGAAIPMNYLTAQFALAERGQLREGETVLVHGAAGGVGTATIQVAKGYGARTIAVVVHRGEGRRRARGRRRRGGAHRRLPDAVKELTDGRGVDVVMDVVGGDLITDSLRSLGTQGRLLVVGFTAGRASPRSRSTGCCSTTSTSAASAGAPTRWSRPGYMRQQWDELLPMMESGVIDPPIGTTYPIAEVSRALVDMEQRRVLGKAVLTFG